MRPSRLLPVALAVAALGLAAPASAAVPGSRDEGVHVPEISCVGDTVRVTAVVRGVRDVGPLTVTLLARAGGGAWTATGRSTTVAAPKPGRGSWTFDVAGLPAGVTSLRADVRAAGATVSTPVLASAGCAPGTEVPEVPAGALVPLTLAATAGLVLASQGRRSRSGALA